LIVIQRNGHGQSAEKEGSVDLIGGKIYRRGMMAWMAWPEKVGLGCACLILAFGVWTYFAVTSKVPSGAFTDRDLVRLVIGVIKTEFFVALPIWLVARLVDFVIGGPARRKAKAQQNSN
jgi:hypothetical protein